MFSDCFIGSLFRRGKNRTINQENGKQMYGKPCAMIDSIGKQCEPAVVAHAYQADEAGGPLGLEASLAMVRDPVSNQQTTPDMVVGIFIEMERSDVE